MKICITSSGDNLQSQVDPRFGRCRYFIIYDDNDQAFEAILNPNIDAGSGAGIQSAQLVASKNVSQVLTGEVGPKAEKVLHDAKIQIITGETTGISVKDFIEKVKANHPLKESLVNSTNESKKEKIDKVLLGKCIQRGLDLIGKQQRGGLRGGGEQGRQRGFGNGRPNYCVCPKCGEKVPHRRGIPCRTVGCPKCGSTMVRE